MIDTPQRFSEHTSLEPQKIWSENFSNYIVYVDESGDHGLTIINPDYPIFVLAFCIFEKLTYTEKISTDVRKLKFKYFGHDMTILHEQEIRKSINQFNFLSDSEHKKTFMGDLNLIIKDSPFTLIAVAIEKFQYKEKYTDLSNPYHVAMQFGLERVYDFLLVHHENKKTTHIVFESRGKNEDAALELEFRRTCAKNNKWNKTLPFELIFGGKPSNCCGLQIADLVARPIGRHLLNKAQENRAYAILKPKFYSKNGLIEGHGLNHLP